jgi:lipoyl(octanoyl) transferase
MTSRRHPPVAETAAPPALRVYLLGSVDFGAALALQKALVYETAADPAGGALVVCEHPPLITVGREGSPADILFDPGELRARRWPVRWVNRGGGCLLHLPGQFALYPILPLDRHRLGVEAYLEHLGRVAVSALDDFSVRAETRPGRPGVWAGGRLLADVGVAVWDWVSYYGMAFNLEPDLAPFRQVRCGGPGGGPMTSLVRERGAPLRPSLVRERLLEHFAAAFGFHDVALFFSHRLLGRPAPAGEVLSPR